MRISLLILSLVFATNSWAKGKTQNGWEAYAELQNGNIRFYEGKSTHPRQTIAHREKLAEGQEPHTILISCSDSRVPPEQIFDQGLGDIFSIRVAGNVLGSDEIASVEYAVEHLGAGLLVIMGHESCGAVKAAIETKPGMSAGSPHLDELIAKIRPQASEAYRTISSDSNLREPVKANVKFVAKDLIARSKIVREAVAKKRLVIAQAIYSLSSGRVDFWDVGGKQYVSSKEHSVEEDLLAESDESSVPERRAPKIISEKVITEHIVPERMPASQVQQ
jgi:carbonic anhydrase